MIKPEEFKKLVEDLEAGVAPTADLDVLATTIRALDVQLLIAQNALDLSMENARIAVSNIAEQVLAACGRTDQKTKKKIAEMAAGMVARCEESVQMYLAKALLEATSTLGLEWPEAEESAEDPDLWSSSEPDPLWAPHNHD